MPMRFSSVANKRKMPGQKLSAQRPGLGMASESNGDQSNHNSGSEQDEEQKNAAYYRSKTHSENGGPVAQYKSPLFLANLLVYKGKQSVISDCSSNHFSQNS